MMTGYGMVQDQNMEKQIEKQMGCMTGFLHIFDRHHILSGKKAYSTKRLPPSKVVDYGQGSEKSGSSTPAISRELVKPLAATMTPPPEKMVKSPVPEITPPRSPLPLPVFEMKDGSKSSWKYCKEAHRLSLDSRATVDAKGSLHPREIRTNSVSSILAANADDKQRSSPSVIARLMGLEPLQADSNAASEESTPKNVQLRRSASESRVARYLFRYHPVENNCNNYNNMNSFHSNLPHSITHDGNICSVDHTDVYSFKMANANAEPPKQPKNNRGIVSSPWKAPQSRRSYFDTADVFPEPRQQIDSIYGDIEKRLKLRGIDEPSKDLDTLKQILEALQLKGLLHSNNRPSEQRNFVYDKSFWSSDQSPIVLMRPSRSPVNQRLGSESPPSRCGVRRSPNNKPTGEYQSSSSPRRERPVIGRGLRNPTRPGNARSSNSGSSSVNSIIKPKPLTVETQRSMDSRRVSTAAHSPKLSSRRNVMSQDPKASNRSPRRRRSPTTNVVITEDESSSISESTISTPSQTDTERSKMEDYREGGKSLLERCDKLLHSIAEMNNAAADTQPSPVSVLDTAFFRDESSSTSSPSPVMKRSIDFKENEQEQASDLDLDEEAWSYILRPDDQSILGETSADGDLVYISEILMASRYLPEDCDVYLLLEKQQYLKGNASTKVSRLQRKLIFDIVVEILDRNRYLPPWMAFSWADSPTIKSSVRRIRSEFLKIRERDSSDHDLLEVICGVLKKDLAGDAMNGWGDCPPAELSEAVLDIERLIFKDLIGESIRDLAEFASKSRSSLAPAPRRKLIF